MEIIKGKLILFCAIIFLFSCTKTYTDEEINNLFEPLTSRFGIKIVYEINEDFAPILIGGKRAQFSKLEPIDDRVLARYAVLLEEAFKKYPVHIIKENLSAVYFARTIEADGYRCGGTYDPFQRIVYLANGGSLNDDRAIANFHHEFSSLMLNRHGFLINPWIDQNPKNFRYVDEVFNDWSEFTLTLDGKTNDYEKGFMNTYAQTNFENDFNEYAAMIFTHPQKFKKIMSQYTRVRGKFLILLEFYHKIDPIFTEEYLLGEK